DRLGARSFVLTPTGRPVTLANGDCAHFGTDCWPDVGARSSVGPNILAVHISQTATDLSGTVQQIVQYSGQQTADRDRSGQNRVRELFRRKPLDVARFRRD